MKSANKKGLLVGYVRVSTYDQNEARQLNDIATDKLFVDKASGKNANRPQMEALLDFVREGDTVIVHSMDRLARNLLDLRRLVENLTSRGVQINFVKEQLSFTGDDAPMAQLLLNVMGAFAEFERSFLLERQREGIALAKKRGAYKGRKRALNDERIAEMKTHLAAGKTKAAVAREMGITRSTLYKYLAGEREK